MKNPGKKIQKSRGRLLELEPYGLVVTPFKERPVFVLKDKRKKETLPVWLNEYDAQMVPAESEGYMVDGSPHGVSLKVIRAFGYRVKSCIFKRLQGHNQFVELVLEGLEDRSLQKSIFCRADGVMSMCLRARVRFFAEKKFIEQSQDVHEALIRQDDGQAILNQFLQEEVPKGPFLLQ